MTVIGGMAVARKKPVFRRTWFLVLAGLVALELLLAVAAPYLYDVDARFRPLLEREASAAMGHPVQVELLTFSLFPIPHGIVQGVTLDHPQGRVTVGRVDVYGDLAALLQGDIHLTLVEIDRVVAPVTTLMAMKALGEPAGGEAPAAAGAEPVPATAPLRLDRVTLNGLHLVLADGTRLEPYQLDVALDERLWPVEVNAHGPGVRVTAQPGAESTRFQIQASDWTPPLLQPAVPLKKLAMWVTLAGERLTLESMELEALGGKLYASGEADLTAGGGTPVQGVFTLEKLDGVKVAKLLGTPWTHGPLSVAGKGEVALRDGFRNGEFTLAEGTVRAMGGVITGVGKGTLVDGLAGGALTYTAQGVDAAQVGKLAQVAGLAGRIALEGTAELPPGAPESAAARLTTRGHAILSELVVDRAVLGEPAPPDAPVLNFAEVAADYTVVPGHYRLDNVAVTGLDGTVTGAGELTSAGPWRLDSRWQVAGIQLEPLFAFLDQEGISGRLDFTGSVGDQVDDPAQLLARPEVNGDFTIHSGILHKADLEGAVSNLSGEKKGGKTPFDTLRGHLEMADETITVTDMAIDSKAIEAKGRVQVTGMSALDGRLEVGLKSASALVGIPIQVSGTVDEPSVRPSNDAIAGGTVGTLLLGPGVGTAVGIKVGQGLHRLGTLLGGGGKKAEAADAPSAPPPPVTGAPNE